MSQSLARLAALKLDSLLLPNKKENVVSMGDVQDCRATKQSWVVMMLITLS